MGVITLLYHRVNDIEKDVFNLAVHPEAFQEQMIYIKEHYPIVRFEDDWNQIEGNAICVTFDDGYMDTFQIALPILEQLKIPATVFVTTGIMDHNRGLWWDALADLLLDDTLYEHEFCLKDNFFSCTWNTRNLKERSELFFTMHTLMRDYISLDKRENWLEQLRNWHPLNRLNQLSNQTIHADEISKNLLKHELLTIGAHTVSHSKLSKLSAEQQLREIQASKEYLEDLLDRSIDVFSYPFGGKGDYDQDSIDICREVGVKKAASNFPGIWIKEKTDELQIPRLRVQKWDISEFAKEIEHLWYG